jgi:hypothetical protein
VFQPGGEIEQQGGDTLVGAQGAEDQGLRRLPDNFAAQQLQQPALEGAGFAARAFEMHIWNQADRTVFERDGVTCVPAVVETFEAERVAAEMEAHDLLAAAAVRR